VLSLARAAAKPQPEQAVIYEVQSGRRLPLRLASSSNEQNSQWQRVPNSNSIAILRVESEGKSLRAGLAVVDLNTEKETTSVVLPGDWSGDNVAERSLIVSPDGAAVAITHASRVVFIRVADRRVQEFARLRDSSSVVFSPDGRRAAWIQVRGIGVWDAKEGSRKLLTDARCTPDSVPFPGLGAGLFDPAGKWLASPASDSTCVWDIDAARVAAVLTKPRDPEQADELPLSAVA
jgi:WD40 repeat protein